ncbi:MAG: glycoside hydrolase family 43 protein [Akkermansiaceae bacterium]|jgi:hypothetical protein|nr:glycoside hydrolase family 43 protein [Akkermansiaceae bacterium]
MRKQGVVDFVPDRHGVDMMKRAVVATLAFLSSLLPFPSLARQDFLFVTFRGEQDPMAEQIHFGLSNDGLHWRALNGGRPALVSTVGEKGARDPFLIRSPDGTLTYLLATDLSIHLHGHDWNHALTRGSRSILIWESMDLVNWSAPRLIAIAPEDASCAWAPEAIYDEETEDYLVFWASKTARDDFRKLRIWAARTRDFHSFTKPFIYLEKPADVIDTTIIRHQLDYLRFSKDESAKAILMERAPRLDGPWQEVRDFSLANGKGYEGPTCFPLFSATAGHGKSWCLLLDHYSRSEGYKAFISRDPDIANFAASAEVRFPFRFRHGSVLPISRAEAERLSRAFP